MWWDDRWGHMDGWFWGGGLFGLMMILFWILVIVTIILVVRSLSRGTGGGPASEDHALTILRERYARGEIDEEEYEARRRTLIKDVPDQRHDRQ